MLEVKVASFLWYPTSRRPCRANMAEEADGMAMRHVEVAVIGGGVIGSSIAYHLARQGRTVLVIERAEVAAAPAASWASAGGGRRQGRHAAEAALASEAMVRSHTLEAGLGADVQYQHG